MKKRRFVCNKYKSYAIRNHKFEGGLLEVDMEDVDVIKLIESADGYGVFIHPAETPDELAALKAKPKRNPPADAIRTETIEHDPVLAHQGARGTNAGATQRAGDLTAKRKA
jgi:hypothetical protein